MNKKSFFEAQFNNKSLKMSSELDDDFDPNTSVSNDDNVDSVLIKKILFEMKSEFNRGMCNIPTPLKDYPDDSETSNADYSKDEVKVNGCTEVIGLKNTDNEQTNESLTIYKYENFINEAPSQIFSQERQIEGIKEETVVQDEESNSVTNYDSVLNEKNNDEIEPRKKKVKSKKEVSKNKAASESPSLGENISSSEKKSRRYLRTNEKSSVEVALKRSSRRMSKEYSRESVLQNAIARKEKSFSSLNEDKHRRSSRISDEKSTKHKSKNNSKGDDLSSRGTSESLKNTSKKKSQSLNGSEYNGNESDAIENRITSSTPEKHFKNSTFHTENGFEDELSNHISSSHQSELDSDKGTDSSSNFSAASATAKKKHFSFSQENLQPPVKRSKIEKSPMIPEASDVPPNEPSLPPLTVPQGGICECQRNEGLYPSKSSLRDFCKALDSFEERVVGCTNKVDEDIPLLRPSCTIPLLLMCEVHVARLLRHNSCPSCGLFCTQGIFLQCREKHFFHKGCEIVKNDVPVCPHCASDEFTEVKLSIGSHQYPVFLPTQKLPNNYSARMSINRGSYPELDFKDEEELNELVPQKDLSFSKKKIISDALPSAEKEKLEKLLHAFSSKNDLSQRFSGRAFYQACKHGDAEKVYSMLGNYNKESGSLLALHAAAGNGHLAVVHLLVQSGMSLEVLDKSQYTPLMLATLNGHNSVVKYLIKAGADVAFKGSDGMTALHLAAQVGNLVACHCLLSAANKPLSFVDTTDDGHWTPLVWAAENNHANVVRYLLEKKANPQIKDSEMNIALHWSAFAGSMEITEDLLNYGTDVNAANVHGDTPLHIAARQGADNCVMLLLSRGATTNTRNKAGQLPKDCVLPEFSYCKTAIELNMKIKNLVSKSLFLPKIVMNDISRGHEVNPIQCINNVDSDPFPKDFTYITENCVTSNLPIDRRITSLTGCKCEDTCTTGSCMCAKTSLRCWYDSRGRLLPEFNFEDPPMIFECNQTCQCNYITCKNRVVQRGLRVRLQVCKTKKKNWGVVTLKEIPKGSYVCEYIGEIISDCEADTREDDSYLFDLDNRDGESYCIDACKYGNVTRFVNHSCKPNLVPVRIFVGHHDLHFPRIAFFAARDIAPNEELGFDYGEKFWIIKYKNFTCSCEEINCRYSSETIHDTLEKYKEKLKLEESLKWFLYAEQSF